jgi:hypothetical protein
VAFNIQEFIENTSNGLAREAHFQLIVTLPPVVKADNRKLSILCHSANLPARSPDVAEVRRTGTGILNPFVSGMRYGELRTDFYSDIEGVVIGLFQSWMDSYMSVRTGSTNYHQVEYRKNYATDLELQHFDSEGNVIGHYKFVEAFPVFLGDINFSWSARNSIVNVPVTFKYTYYYSIPVPQQTLKSVPSDTTPQQVNLLPKKNYTPT